MQLSGQDEGMLIALSRELDAEEIGDFVTAAVNDGQGTIQAAEPGDPMVCVVSD